MIDTELLAEEWGDDLLFMTGYDDCIAGVCVRFGEGPIIMYDYEKVIGKLQANDGMSLSEAREWFYFKMLGAGVGKGAPGFLMHGNNAF